MRKTDGLYRLHRKLTCDNEREDDTEGLVDDRVGHERVDAADAARCAWRTEKEETDDDGHQHCLRCSVITSGVVTMAALCVDFANISRRAQIQHVLHTSSDVSQSLSCKVSIIW